MTLTETIVWIPCEERLPDKCRTVLIVDNKGVSRTAWHHAESGHWVPFLGDTVYWAELPRGPQP